MKTTSEHAARVLDILGEVSHKTVQRARRELAMKYHPDRFKDKEGATRHMARINAAADALIEHIRVENVANPESARMGNPVSADMKKAGKCSAGIKAINRKPVSTAPVGCTTAHDTIFTAGSRPSAQTAQAAKRLNRSRTPSGADLALSRMAAASYRDVLGRIGTMDDGPTVDIRVSRMSRMSVAR